MREIDSGITAIREKLSKTRGYCNLKSSYAPPLNIPTLCVCVYTSSAIYFPSPLLGSWYMFPVVRSLANAVYVIR